MGGFDDWQMRMRSSDRLEEVAQGEVPLDRAEVLAQQDTRMSEVKVEVGVDTSVSKS